MGFAAKLGSAFALRAARTNSLNAVALDRPPSSPVTASACRRTSASKSSASLSGNLVLTATMGSPLSRFLPDLPALPAMA